jgi:hypothetical protein
MPSPDESLRSPLAERSPTRARLWRFTRNRNHLYRLIVTAKNDSGGREFVRRDSKIVIDGFERSGNTFAFLAFLDANPHVASVGHHTHSPAQFHWAHRWRIPTVLLVREPAAVALSVNLRWPARGLGDVLEDYARFHERVLAQRGAFVVARFEDTTTRFGHTLAAVNARFETSFEPYEATPAADERVFAAIEARNQARYGRLTEVAVARPSASRQVATEQRRADLDEPRVHDRLQRARDTYAQVLERADP